MIVDTLEVATRFPQQMIICRQPVDWVTTILLRSPTHVQVALQYTTVVLVPSNFAAITHTRAGGPVIYHPFALLVDSILRLHYQVTA